MCANFRFINCFMMCKKDHQYSPRHRYVSYSFNTRKSANISQSTSNHPPPPQPQARLDALHPLLWQQRRERRQQRQQIMAASSPHITFNHKPQILILPPSPVTPTASVPLPSLDWRARAARACVHLLFCWRTWQFRAVFLGSSVLSARLLDYICMNVYIVLHTCSYTQQTLYERVSHSWVPQNVSTQCQRETVGGPKSMRNTDTPVTHIQRPAKVT